jgi:hypothetical protein
VAVRLLRGGGGGAALPRGRGSALRRVRPPRARRQRAVAEARARAGEPTFLCADCGDDEGAPVEGFSGCPSAAELAASWGLDLRGGYAGEEEEDAAFFSALDCSMLAVDPDPRDLYVPCDPPASSRAPRRLKGDALCHQLAEMARRDREPQAHSDLSPSTPRRSSAASSGRLPDKLQAPPTLPPPPPPPQEVPLPYTSLLMMATNCPELIGGGDRMAGDDEQLPWDCAAPSVPSAQVNYKTKSRQMGGKKRRHFYCLYYCILVAGFYALQFYCLLFHPI